MNKSVDSSDIKSQLRIYIYDNEIEWATNLGSQLHSFGYEVEIFRDHEVFNLATQNKIDKQLVLLVNVDLVTTELEKVINKLKQQLKNNVAIIFTANSGDASLRLKAIRSDSCAFLIKPFATEDLVMQLESILSIEKNNYKILIVDDDVDSAKLYARILINAGMECRMNTSFEEVLPALSEFNPDLILLDVYMPECDGLELTKIIRQQHIYDSIPIMYLSAEDNKTKQLEAMKLGADEFINKSVKPTELIQLISNKINRYKILRSIMIKDGLTCVLNHTNIQHQLEILIKLSNRTNIPLSVAMIDLDNFKRINDTYSHPAGDHVLRSICLMMRRRLRSTDLIGRYGGEEFLIIFPDTPQEGAKYVIEELKDQFSSFAHTWNSHKFFITFSAGIAAFPQFKTASQLIQAADNALYQAKRGGKNRVELISDNEDKHAMEKEIRTSIQMNPVIDKQRLHEIFGNDTAALNEFMKNFITSIDKLLNTLEVSIKDKDKEKAKIAIHQLKGSSGNTGIMQMYELSIQAEEKIKEEDWNNTQKIFSAIIEVFKKLQHEVKEKI